MKLFELISVLQLKTGEEITKNALAHKINSSKQYLNNIKNTELTDKFIERVEEAFNLSVNIDTAMLKQNASEDFLEIPYWEGAKDFPYIKNTLLRNLYFDKEFIHNIWQRNHKTLRIIKMLGDEMDGIAYGFKNGDILLMCVEDNNPCMSGVYVYTTEVDGIKNLFISGIRQRINGNFEFYFDKNEYPSKERSLQELEEINMKIIGRIVVDLSKTL